MKAGLRFLLNHSRSLDGANGGLGLGLSGLGEGVDVIEYVGAFGDLERVSEEEEELVDGWKGDGKGEGRVLTAFV